MSQSTDYDPHHLVNDLGTRSELELPSWGHAVGRSVFPLFINDGGRLFPVGTAFLISRYGYVLTAAHSIIEGIRREKKLERFLERIEEGGKFDLSQIGFSVLVHYPTNGQMRVHFCPLEHIGGAPPTDLVIGSIANFHDPDPLSPLKLSVGMPRALAKVVAVGYYGADPEGGIELREIELEPERLLTHYAQKIRICAGNVRAIFATRFSRGYAQGPCFLTDFSVLPGQSGGPVIGPTGVCGLVTGSATAFVEHNSASLVSLLYPLLTTNVVKTIRFAPQFSLNFGVPFLQLIRTALVSTDGSEEKIHLKQVEEGGWSSSHLAEDANSTHVFEDFERYQRGEPCARHRPG